MAAPAFPFEQAVDFGPFQMENLRRHLDDRLRTAFYAYLQEEVFALIEGRVVRVEGRFFSHYDRPQFANNETVQRRYYYEVGLVSSEGTESAWGELDYNPATAALTTNHVKPPGVLTLSEKREMAEREREEEDFQTAHADFPGTICPRCQSRAIASIAYGLFPIPLPPTMRRAIDEGVYILGGCVLSAKSPMWCCLDCGCRWGRNMSWGDFSR